MRHSIVRHSPVLLLLLTGAAAAQQMTGPWVEQTHDKIDALRKTDLRVIVLDAAGRPAPRATVRIEQVGHEFTLGFVIGEAGLPPLPSDAPVLRCFNAVSLERFTDMAALQPRPLGEPDFAPIDALVAEAKRAGLAIRWGPMISADPARNPDWEAAVSLTNAELAFALDNFVERIARRYGRDVDAFNLYTHSLDHVGLADRLGWAAVRQLHERARAAAPRATIALQLENCLTEVRLDRAIQQAEQVRQRFIRFDEAALPQRIGGLLLQRRLSRGLELLGKLGAPVTVGPLEVGGSSDAAAAENLETLLRLLFAAESVRGIYFAGLTVADVSDATAALIDNAGHPLLPGAVVDGLFHRAWWTDEAHAADELGNVYARVFAGTHRITATIPQGPTVSMTVYLSRSPPRGLAQHVVLMEPMKE